jgi:transcription elongation factor GreA
MDSISMTAAELEALQAELGELETAGRSEIAARIKTAREWGDLKENAEYHAAKEAQAHLETHILKLREQVRHAAVVERTGDAGVVQHGSSVTFSEAAKGGRVKTFKIVSPNEAKPSEGTLSSSSPVAQALVGRRVGDTVAVPTPSGSRRLKIEAVA